MQQCSFKTSRQAKPSRSSPCDCSLVKVFTVRGRTYAVVGMFAVASDDACGAAQSLAESITAEGLAQVEFVTVDNPSRHYLLSLKNICPNLQVMALDPVHLAMPCEYASSRKRTQATKTLHCILS